jgi:hypothetical protein
MTDPDAGLRPHQKASGRNPQMPCLHCGARTVIRETRKHHECFREVTYQCTVAACSAAFVCHVEAVRVISPSGRPNPRLRLPTRQREPPRRPYDGDGDVLLEAHQTGPPAAAEATLPLPF